MFCSCRLLCRMSSKDRHIESSCPSYIKTEPSSPASLTDSVITTAPADPQTPAVATAPPWTAIRMVWTHPLFTVQPVLWAPAEPEPSATRTAPAPSRRTRQLNASTCWTPCPSAYVWFAGTSPPATITVSPPARPARPFSRGTIQGWLLPFLS